MPRPTYSRERAHGGIVAGVDEVGRGCLAGPVVAAAVILDARRIPPGMRDSKVLTAAEREALSAKLQARHCIGIGVASVAEIDEINIYHASHLAMIRAVAALAMMPCLVLVDGNASPKWEHPTKTIVGGDDLCLSISAASIVAKVARDAMMVALHAEHPHYDWASNKGYGTPLHRAGLLSRGPSVHHRRFFAPVAAAFAMPPFEELTAADAILEAIEPA